MGQRNRHLQISTKSEIHILELYLYSLLNKPTGNLNNEDWILREQLLIKLDSLTSEVFLNNKFICSIYQSVKSDRLSKKQAYYFAKTLVECGYKLGDYF